jgi:hypothetical protein
VSNRALIKLSPPAPADKVINGVVLMWFVSGNILDITVSARSLTMKPLEMGPAMVDRNESAEQDPARSAIYEQTIRLGIREITRRLNACLGGTLVATLAGSKDTKASHRWAKEGGPEPRPEAVKRLAFAYEQWQKVAEAEGEHVARLWFIGANPWLDYDTPVNAIREGRYKEASNAAQALVDDSFGG